MGYSPADLVPLTKIGLGAPLVIDSSIFTKGSRSSIKAVLVLAIIDNIINTNIPQAKTAILRVHIIYRYYFISLLNHKEIGLNL
jgi:hypothetical protein